MANVASGSPLKRSLDDDHLHILQSSPQKDTYTLQPSVLTPPNSTGSLEQSEMLPDAPMHPREASPALSSTTLSSVPPSSAVSAAGGEGTHTATNSLEPPRKRRKLTVQEKEEQKKEKEEKARLREEKRAQKDAENAVKEEQRRTKAEERRNKNEEKEAKQRERDLAKKQKEEEETKKEQRQKRLGAFFVTPKPKSAGSPETPAAPKLSCDVVASTDVIAAKAEAQQGPDHVMTDAPAQPSDYQKFFLPFELPSHTTWAAASLVSRTDQDLSDSQAAFDQIINSAEETSPEHPSLQLSQYFRSQTRRPKSQRPLTVSVKTVMDRIQGTADKPVDLTDSATSPREALRSIDMKHIHFCEDVRPPYSGTFTKITSPARIRKSGRTPFDRMRKDTNYDYDSEAEWEEPEEGEDIMSEGEDDAESNASADEMDGFLDDGDEQTARKQIVGELVPVSTGVCFEGASVPAEGNSEADLHSMRLEWLLEEPVQSVDPFSTVYWEVKTAPEPPVSSHPPPRDLFAAMIASPARNSSDGLMKPPRAPLQPSAKGANSKLIVGAKTGEKGPIMAVAAPKAVKAPIEALTGSKFDDFKDAVEGSNLTKVELLKALKSRFPDIRNEQLKETLVSRFARVGSSAGKHWASVAT